MAGLKAIGLEESISLEEKIPADDRKVTSAGGYAVEAEDLVG